MFTPVTGRTVIVTGGTKGIGKGIARVFAQAGANVVVVGRDAATGEAAASELGGALRAGRHRAAPPTASGWRPRPCERFGGIDVLCANAGIFPDVKLADMTEADIDAIFATNVKGTMLSVKACMPALERSGHGRVIITSSITGPITGYPGWSHYGATKAAQLGFLRTAAIELAAKGITINAVMPGNVVTEGLAELGPDYRASMEASIPQKKLGSGRGHRPRRAVLRDRRGELHHRADDRRRRRPGAAGVADGVRGHVGGALAVSLGPTALAAREAPAGGARGGRARRPTGRRARPGREARRLALDDPRRAGRPRAQRRRATDAAGRAGGIFVAERKVERDLTSLASLPAYLRRQGFEAGHAGALHRDDRAPTPRPRRRCAARAALVLEVVRVRLADGEPISLERARFPAERFPDLLDRSLSGSLYELFQTRYGLVAGRGGGAHRGGRRGRGRGAAARPARAARRCWRSPAPHGMPTGGRSSARRTCFGAPIGPGSSCARGLGAVGASRLGVQASCCTGAMCEMVQFAKL